MMAKKRAILTNSLYAGGAERVVSLLYSYFFKQNLEIELITVEKKVFYKLPKDAKIIYLSNFDGSQNGFLKLLLLPYFAYKLKKIIKQHDIELVQSHVLRANYINILAKLFGSSHKAQIVNSGKISRYTKGGISGKINLFLIKHLYKRADLIISKSLGMQLDMQELFNFDNSSQVINNPYDISKIIRLSKERVSEFYFDKKKRYLICVGRLIELKRNQDVIKALSYLDDLSVEVIFLGDGDQKYNLLKLARELNVQNRVHFLGRVENPFKFISKCDIFISASRTEGFPNVLVEAMLCRCVVISSDCISGPREILAPGSGIYQEIKGDFEEVQFGLLYKVGNVKGLSSAITYMLQNRKLKTELMQKAYQRAVSSYNFDRIFKLYQEVMFGDR